MALRGLNGQDPSQSLVILAMLNLGEGLLRVFMKGRDVFLDLHANDLSFVVTAFRR